jgi:hypothetical protein
MDNSTHEAGFLAIEDDDLSDYEGVPEDGQQAWLSLLLIGMIAGSAGTTLYGFLWAVS